MVKMHKYIVYLIYFMVCAVTCYSSLPQIQKGYLSETCLNIFLGSQQTAWHVSLPQHD